MSAPDALPPRAKSDVPRVDQALLWVGVLLLGASGW